MMEDDPGARARKIPTYRPTPMRPSVLLAVFALGAATPAAAQLTVTWTPRADLNAGLPAGVRVYETRTTVRRGANVDSLRAWLVRADTNGATWAVGARLSDAAGGLETVTSFAAEPGVLLAVNGGYFGGGASVSLVAEGGQVLARNVGALARPAGTYYPTRAALGVLPDGRLDVAWVYHVAGTIFAYPNPSPNTQTAPQPPPSAAFPAGGTAWAPRTAMGGGPVLVERGRRRVTWEDEVFFGSGVSADSSLDAQPRTAVGYTPAGEVLMIVADGRQPASGGLALTELADLFIQLGAAEALNLDGGGSSTLAVGTTLVNRPSGGTFQRAVASALVLGPKTAAPPPAQTYDFDADVASPTYRETGSWIESSNTPYHGATKARLNAADGKGDRAVFRLAGIPPGHYEVAAWWVPSTNRATNTPFTVSCTSMSSTSPACPPTTVRVNQADGTTLGKWNVLGTFPLSSADSVVVTDDATPAGNFVVADGLRLTYKSVLAVGQPAVTSRALRVFPNPARTSVTVEVGPASAGTGGLYDVLGRRVAAFDVPASGGLVPVPLVGVAPGLYVVRVGASTARVVVR